MCPEAECLMETLGFLSVDHVCDQCIFMILKTNVKCDK